VSKTRKFTQYPPNILNDFYCPEVGNSDSGSDPLLFRGAVSGAPLNSSGLEEAL